MVRTLIVSCALQCGLCLSSSAQITTGLPSILEHPPMQQSSPNAPWREVLENHGSTPLIAVLTTFHCPKSSEHIRTEILFINDPLYHFSTDHAIPPGGSLEIGSANPEQCPGGVSAAIFEDGHTEGDPADVKRLYLRRVGVLRGIGFVLSLLEPLTVGKLSSQEFLDKLMAESRRLGRAVSLDSNERVGTEAVLSQIRLVFASPNANLIVPSDFSTNKQPAFSELAESRHISMLEAKGLVVSAKLGEWKRAIEINSPLP